MPGWISPMVQLMLPVRLSRARSSGWVPHVLPTMAPFASVMPALPAMEWKGISVSWLTHAKHLPKRLGEHQALIRHIGAVPGHPSGPAMVRGSVLPLRRTAALADGKGVCLQEALSLCLASGKGGEPLLHGLGRSDHYHCQAGGRTLVFVLHQCQG